MEYARDGPGNEGVARHGPPPLANLRPAPASHRHRSQEFLKFLEEVDRQLAVGPEVHIVMDNYGTHKIPKVKPWFARHPAITCTLRPPAPVG